VYFISFFPCTPIPVINPARLKEIIDFYTCALSSLSLKHSLIRMSNCVKNKLINMN